MRNRLKCLIVVREDDRETLKEYFLRYRKMNKYQLVQSYNSACNIGIVGVRQQALSYLIMHRVFLSKFEKSPFELIDETFISVTNYIFLIGDAWEYINEN